MKTRDEGFTAIEMIITVIVAALMIIAINALYSAVVRSSSIQRNRAEASDLAYANLRNYAYNGASAKNWFSCTTSGASANDGYSKPGSQLSTKTYDATQTSIPQPVTVTVTADAPYGCSGSNAGTPILVTSTVTFGPSADTITHSEYVGY